MAIQPKNIVIATISVFFLSAIFAVFSLIIWGFDKPIGEGFKKPEDLGGNFTLTTDKGKVSLYDLKGKVVVIYFGFMNCTEACPISMRKMKAAYERLNPEEQKKFQGAFLSIDPEQDDDPVELNAFVRNNYNPTFIGWNGTAEEIDKVKEQYGVYAKPTDFQDPASGTFTVDHSSRFYIIDTEGDFVSTMSHSTTVAELVAKVRSLM